MSDTETTDDGEEAAALFLDEEDEQYGWGIFNTHRKEFVAPLGGGPRGGDQDTFEDKEDLIEYYTGELADTVPEMNHLRVVRIHLDNELDKEVAEIVQEDSDE